MVSPIAASEVRIRRRRITLRIVAIAPMAGKSWTVAVQSETTRAGYGPTDQSFPIDTPGSPVCLEWIGARPSVRLETNFDTIAHPGGEGYFTWFVLMDHTAHGGGPFPQPNELLSKVRVTFSDMTPHGATRAFVGFGGVWDGKMRGVEVCFAIANWGDNDPAADVISTVNNASLKFAVMNGAAMGITAIRNQETQVEVAWHKIIPDLVCRGYFKPPQQGWEQTQTAAVYVGTEVNNFTASAAARASLIVADFRVECVRAVMPRS
jgi:hypothetical protein